MGQASLPAGQHWYNDVLNSPTAGIENAIGIWKGRFPLLHSIRMRIKGKASMVKDIKYITVTIILHNLCIKTPFKHEWLTDDDDLDIDLVDELDGLNVRVDPKEENCNHHSAVHMYLYHELMN